LPYCLSAGYTTLPGGLVQWEITNNCSSAVFAVLIRGASCSPYYMFGNAFWQNYLRKVPFQYGTNPNSVGIGLVKSPQNAHYHMGFVYLIAPGYTLVQPENVFGCQITGFTVAQAQYVGTQVMKIGYDPKIASLYPLPAYLPNPRRFSVPIFQTDAYLGELISPVYLDDPSKIVNLALTGVAVGLTAKTLLSGSLLAPSFRYALRS